MVMQVGSRLRRAGFNIYAGYCLRLDLCWTGGSRLSYNHTGPGRGPGLRFALGLGLRLGLGPGVA